MVKGIGIDVIEVKRIKALIKDYKDHAIEKIFTEEEIYNSKGQKMKYQYYSGRFAAKEATMKALGKGLDSGIKWKDIEILNDKEGKPFLNFYGKALEYKFKKRIKGSEVSITHIKEIAIAVVILF